MKLSLFAPSFSGRSTIASNLNLTKKSHSTVQSANKQSDGTRILPIVPVVQRAEPSLESFSEQINDPLLKKLFGDYVRDGAKIPETALLAIEPWNKEALILVNSLSQFVGENQRAVQSFSADLLRSLLSKGRNRGAILKGHYSSISYQAQELKKATNNAKSGEEIENRVDELFNFISDLEGQNLANQQTLHIVGRLVKNVYDEGLNLQLFSDKSTEAAANENAQAMTLDLADTMKEGIDALREARNKFPDLFSKEEDRANHFTELEERFESQQAKSQKIQRTILAEINGLLPEEVDKHYRESVREINTLLGYQQTKGVHEYLELARKRTDQTKDHAEARIASIDSLLQDNLTPEYYVKEQIDKIENAISYVNNYDGKLAEESLMPIMKRITSMILERVSASNPRKIIDSGDFPAINSAKTLAEIKEQLQSQLEILRQLEEFPEKANTLFVELKARHNVLASARPNKKTKASLDGQEKLKNLLAEVDKEPLFKEPLKQIESGKQAQFSLPREISQEAVDNKLAWFDTVKKKDPTIDKLYSAFVNSLRDKYVTELSGPIQRFSRLRGMTSLFTELLDSSSKEMNIDLEFLGEEYEEMANYLAKGDDGKYIEATQINMNSILERGLKDGVFMKGKGEQTSVEKINSSLREKKITEESLQELRTSVFGVLAKLQLNPITAKHLELEIQDLQSDAPEIYSEILKTIEKSESTTDIAEAEPTLPADVSSPQNTDANKGQPETDNETGKQIDEQDDTNPQSGQGGSPKPIRPTEPNSGGDNEVIIEKSTGEAEVKTSINDSSANLVPADTKPAEKVNWKSLASRTRQMLKAGDMPNAEPEKPLEPTQTNSDGSTEAIIEESIGKAEVATTTNDSSANLVTGTNKPDRQLVDWSKLLDNGSELQATPPIQQEVIDDPEPAKTELPRDAYVPVDKREVAVPQKQPSSSSKAGNLGLTEKQLEQEVVLV